MALTNKLTAIANAIRAKTGSTAKLTLDQMPAAIASIETGGGGGDNLEEFITRTIKTFSNSSITKIGDSAFESCEKLTSVNCPAVTKIGHAAFQYNYSLTSINFGDVTSIGMNAFANCPYITEADFPYVTELEGGTFYQCKNLTNVNIPNVTKVQLKDFSECYALTKLDLPSVTYIYTQAFYYSEALEAVILRSPTVCTMNNANAFTGTPIASGTGYIYVPKALIEDYKAAARWSYYANQFRAIEDYPNICG